MEKGNNRGDNKNRINIFIITCLSKQFLEQLENMGCTVIRD